MHMIFLILKIIGIILLVLLAVLLLVTVVIFLAPFKYRVEGSYHGGLLIRFRASWLFHLLRMRAEYDRENGLQWVAYLAWIKRSGDTKEDVDKDPEALADIDAAESAGTVENTGAAENAGSTEDTGAAENALAAEDTGAPENAGMAGNITAADMEEDASLQMMELEEPEKRGLLFKIRSAAAKIKDRISGIWKRFRRIKYTFRNICDKIKHVNEKKDAVLEFLHDPGNQRVIRRIWDQMLVLLRRLRPKKCYIKGVIGFRDPALTGKLFGGIGILYAWIGEGIQLVPDFEEEVMELDFLAKGNFRLVYVLIAGMRLMMDRETRRFLMSMKKKFS